MHPVDGQTVYEISVGILPYEIHPRELGYGFKRKRDRE